MVRSMGRRILTFADRAEISTGRKGRLADPGDCGRDPGRRVEVGNGPNATFCCPDRTTFSCLNDLGPEVVGRRVMPDRAVLACRVVEADQWCRRRAAKGSARTPWRASRLSKDEAPRGVFIVHLAGHPDDACHQNVLNAWGLLARGATWSPPSSTNRPTRARSRCCWRSRGACARSRSGPSGHGVVCCPGEPWRPRGRGPWPSGPAGQRASSVVPGR